MDQSGTSSHRFAVFGWQWAIFGTFADQACSSPTFATPKWPTLGRESPKTCKSPTHWATSAWQGIMGPCNAQCRALGLAPKFGLFSCWALCTFHSSFPPCAPPCGPGTPCPGTKMAKPAKMVRHHIVGGQLGCGLGLWITTWQV